MNNFINILHRDADFRFGSFFTKVYTVQLLYSDFASRLTNSLGTQSKIYYEPDDGDDWDEEDPDDDLDF